MKLPNRKPTRLKNFDYSSEGAYFITICTHNKQKILCDIVGDGACDIPKINLSYYGEITSKNPKKRIVFTTKTKNVIPRECEESYLNKILQSFNSLWMTFCLIYYPY